MAKLQFDSVDAFLNQIPSLIPQGDARLKVYHAAFRLNTTNGRGWNIRVNDACITLPEILTEPVECTLTMSENVLMDILNQRLNPVKAILFRKVKVEGNPATLLSLLKLIF